jgi:dipeptidyl aminopeptidase/acylaminoacyl peptidase
MPSLVTRLVTALALLPMLALAAPPAKPLVRPSRQYTIEQFLATTDLMGASFSPDEKKLLFSSNGSGVFNAYSVPVRGGKPTQLTQARTEATFAVSYFPKDERILFTRAPGGSEHSHLYVRELNGQERDLTPGEAHTARFLGWKGDDGSAFYVLTNERDARFFDLYRYDVKTYARSLLYQNDGNYQVAAISRDEKWIALGKPRTLADSDIHLYEVAKKEHKHITPHQGTASYTVSEFDPGSTALYLLTDDGSEFSRVARYVLATGKLEDVERVDWDIQSTAFSSKGAWRVTTVNEDGSTVIRLHDVKAGRLVKLPQLPGGSITTVSIARSEKRLAFYLDGERSPSNLYVYDFTTRKATRLTASLSPELDAEDLVEGQVVRFKSFDGLEIPNILYKPHQATPENKAPAVVWVTGGPGGQSRKGYMALSQYLANHGYVVLAINHRGNSGYGKTFSTADDQKHGREPLRDCVEAKKYLARLPYVDERRIGIAGASYGGYMALAALTFHPDVFQAGVDAFGISNWLSALEGFPPEREAFREALFQEMGDPVKQRQMLEDISPIFHMEKIQKPLLVIQGAQDPRVPKKDADALVQALKKNGVPVDYLLLADEGHGFTQKKSEVEATQRVLSFLDQYLKQ